MVVVIPPFQTLVSPAHFHLTVAGELGLRENRRPIGERLRPWRADDPTPEGVACWYEPVPQVAVALVRAGNARKTVPR
jgi:hypothetical protein